MGDAAGIKMAKEEIDKIVGEKTAKQTIKLEGLDNKYYLLLTPAVNALEEELDVKIYVPTAIIEGFNQAISISGDKEKVQAAKAALEKAYADLENKTRTVSVSIPKRQHKYLYGKNSETLKEIFNESGKFIVFTISCDCVKGNITIIFYSIRLYC
jgi:hypothetical protein